ncbi:retrovirus-related Pol polyprotein from transposon 412 [Trichonephila clavipes]|uniref:Retrovirus-related Pol polyprotein from transposon 412 n=1 Tax=Trichonephila clavipes TaxID=2585209 RepID=A0A8X6S7V5_TRICX|nr:retrovirus-related Pol polyprotein from transposon 412 [Trichonephila clavipes]
MSRRSEEYSRKENGQCGRENSYKNGRENRKSTKLQRHQHQNQTRGVIRASGKINWRILRSVVHKTTGYSPSQMLFGRDLRLPTDLFSQPPDAPLELEEYVNKLQARMKEMHYLARDKISMTFEKIKTRYDTRATGYDFHEGDD